MLTEESVTGCVHSDQGATNMIGHWRVTGQLPSVHIVGILHSEGHTEGPSVGVRGVRDLICVHICDICMI